MEPVSVYLGRVLRETIVEPVRSGRLRDEHWPFGLRAVVLLGYGMFAAAAALVFASGPIRRHSDLTMSGTSALGLPDGAVWPLVVLLSFGLALFATAALKSPWWLKIVGLLVTLLAMGSWSLRRPQLSGSVVWPVVSGLLMLGLVAFTVRRARRPFAWWELAVHWGLVGGAMVLGIQQSRYSQLFGSDLKPVLLQQTASTLGYLVLPAALVAGAAVAEVTVRAATSVTQSAARFERRRWPFVILGVLLLARAGETVWQFRQRDPVTQGVTTFVVAAVLLLAFAGLGLAVQTISGPSVPTPASGLSDDLTRLSFGVAVALIAVNFPAQILLGVVNVLGTVSPRFRQLSANTTPVLDDLVDPIRIAIGLVLVVLAIRAARRGRPGAALVSGCVGIMLIALGRALFFGDSIRLGIDPDVLNLLTSAVVMVAVLVTVVRRRLTAPRAAAFAGVLVLSELFAHRDFVSDPLGLVLGFSGAALLLFGLTWDLFTGAQWGNTDGRRFSRPARVLLVLTNSVLTMTVLAFAALIRDGSTTVYLDVYAEFGDLIFGTALLAAAVLAVLGAAWRDQPVG